MRGRIASATVVSEWQAAVKVGARYIHRVYKAISAKITFTARALGDAFAGPAGDAVGGALSLRRRCVDGAWGRKERDAPESESCADQAGGECSKKHFCARWSAMDAKKLETGRMGARVLWWLKLGVWRKS